MKVSEIRYRRLFESAKDGILILDVTNGKITDANPFIVQLLDFSRTELLGKELWEIGLFGDKKASKSAMRELQEKKYIRYEDLPLETKSGQCIDVEFVSNVYRENGHQVIQCNIRDITERKNIQSKILKAEALVQSAKDNLQRLFMNAPAIIAVLRGPELVFEMANPQYRKLLGTNRKLNGVRLEVAVPDLEPDLLKTIKDAATEGISFVVNELPMVLDWEMNGKVQTKYLNLVFNPLLDEEGNPDGLMCFGNDVTEQVENRKKLEKALLHKEEFLSMASHELRTPVTSIKGYAQLLESQLNDLKDFPQAELVSKLDEQIDKLTALIADLFDDTKVKEGKMILHQEYFDFNALVQESINEVQYTAKEHRIMPTFEELPDVYGDRGRIKQVIVNLLTNAVKYSPRAKNINVHTKMDKKETVFSVQDFGIGIPKEDHSKIFTRFYRVQGEKLDTYPGLGLGLYIAADIIERHGGRIKVKSDQGKGSVFSVSLPARV